jgi:hypothetical protein
MISYFSLKVLIPSHAVPKWGVASGCPAFMGGLSPAPFRLVVPASHAENVTNFGIDKILVPDKISRFHLFSPNYSSCAAHGTFRYFELCSICLRDVL